MQFFRAGTVPSPDAQKGMHEMLMGTECVKVSRGEARRYILSVLDHLYDAQVALAAKDKESEQVAAKAKRDYRSLCYWGARERFDPFVDYVCGIVRELTTGWFWPEEGTGLNPLIPCGFATYYHKEIADKVAEFCDDIREYYEGTPLASTWRRFDKAIRGSVKAYRRMVKDGEKFTYGMMPCEKK